MLFFDLTPYMFASEWHDFSVENKNIRIERNFNKALTEAITCLLYLEYDNSNRVGKLETVTTDFWKMYTTQISRILNYVKLFIGVFPSDLSPHSITRPGTVIVNTDAHTQTGSHWLAIRQESRFSEAFYFDSYGLSPFVPVIQSFLRRNPTVLNYNQVQLQGPTSTVCGQYCSLFALYTDRGYAGRQFVYLFTPGPNADHQVERLFASEFGVLPRTKRGLCCSNRYKK
jgi:hypothetical protein